MLIRGFGGSVGDGDVIAALEASGDTVPSFGLSSDRDAVAVFPSLASRLLRICMFSV